MKKILLLLLFPIAITLSGCVGGLADFDVRSSLAVNSQGFKEFCADRSVVNRFENRIIAGTSTAEGKYAAAKTLIGPAMIPIAGIEALYTGAGNLFDSIVNSEQSQAADKRCEGVE